MQRGDGYGMVPHGVKIRSLPRVSLRSGSAHPVNRIAMRIGGADHGLGLVAVSETRGLVTGESFERYIRHIDVQYGIRGQGIALELVQQTQHHLRRRFKMRSG